MSSGTAEKPPLLSDDMESMADFDDYYDGNFEEQESPSIEADDFKFLDETKGVPQSVLDSFDGAIDKLVGGADVDRDKATALVRAEIDEAGQDRLVILEAELQEGRSVANIMYEAAENNDFNRISDLNKFGSLLIKYTDESDEEARRFGAALQTMAQTQEVLMRDEKWLQEKDMIGESSLGEIEEKLRLLAEQELLPEGIKRLTGAAAEKIARAKKPEQDSIDQPPAEQPEELKQEEKTPVVDKAEVKTPSAPIIDRERLKNEDLPAISRQFREHMANGDNFKAAQFLAKMKQLGIGLKKEGGGEREESIKQSLIAGYEDVVKNKDKDGGVSAARYLSYLKYTGVLDSADDQQKESMLSEARAAFQQAAEQKREDIDWSLYAMHMKYTKAAGGLSSSHKALLENQADKIFHGENVSVDRKVINEARLKFINPDRGTKFDSKKIFDRLAEHNEANNFDAYTRLAVAAGYVDEQQRELYFNAETRRKIRQHIEGKRANNDWDGYLTTAANAAKLAGEKSGGGDISLVLDGQEESTKAAGEPGLEPDAESVLDETTNRGFDETVAAKSDDTDIGKRREQGEPETVAEESEQKAGGVEPGAYPQSEDWERKKQAWFDELEKKAATKYASVSTESGAGVGKDRLSVVERNLQKRRWEIEEQRRQRLNGSEEERWAQTTVVNGMYEPMDTEKRQDTEQRREALIEMIDDAVKKGEASLGLTGERGKRLSSYRKVWLNDLQLRQSEWEERTKVDKVLHAATSAWTERIYNKAVVKGTQKERLRTQDDFIMLMRQVADQQETSDKKLAAVARSLADEMELVNIQDRLRSLKKEQQKIEKGQQKGLKRRSARRGSKQEATSDTESVLQWRFKAMDANWHEVEDVVAANNQIQAERFLRENGFDVTEISPVKEDRKKEKLSLWTLTIEDEQKGVKWKRDVFAKTDSDAYNQVKGEYKVVSVDKTPFWKRSARRFGK